MRGRKTTRMGAIGISLLALAASCARNPVTGWPELTLVSEAKERKLGKAEARRAAPLAVLTGVGAAVTGIVSPTLGDLVGGVGGFAGAFVLAPYSRGQEHDADRIGQELAAKAGWDPAGLSRSLRSLEREEALH